MEYYILGFGITLGLLYGISKIGGKNYDTGTYNGNSSKHVSNRTVHSRKCGCRCIVYWHNKNQS